MIKYFIRNIGVLNTSGTEVVDFINRMSTNDFRKFKTDEFRRTIFTTDKGRIIDIVNVINSENKIILHTSDGFEERVISHLQKYIIMDDVKFEKSKDIFSLITILGEDLMKIAKSILNTEADIEKNKVYKSESGDLIYYDDFKFESINIVSKKENNFNIKTFLKNYKEMNSEEYEYFRIENGLGEGINELNDKINPMECRLEKFISFNKGCYIGQEIIARMDSQGKTPKQIVKIKSDKKLFKENIIFDEEDKEVGFVSSSSDFDNNYSALGFIRSLNLDYEKSYFALNGKEKIKINISKIN